MARPAIREQPLEGGRPETPAKPAQPLKKSTTTRRVMIAGAGLIIVAALVWLATRPARQRAKARHDVEVLAVALDGFAREQGEYPRGEFAQICRLLLGETIDGQNPRKLDYVEAQQYEINVQGEFIDPWGTAYRVLFSPTIRVYSCGPNRIDELGSGDDVAASL